MREQPPPGEKSVGERPARLDHPSGPHAPNAPDAVPGPRTYPPPPEPRIERESILPAVAAALFVGRKVRTRAGAKGDTAPAPHPLVREFLTDLPVEARERWRGRCPEVELVSEHLFEAERNRKGRAARKPFTLNDARRALKGARVAIRRIREDGDPDHGRSQPPCRSCAPMLVHFGVITKEH